MHIFLQSTINSKWKT